MPKNPPAEIRRNTIALSVAFGVSSLFAFVAMAEQSSASKDTKPLDSPPVIETLKGEGARIIERFEGPDGLAGYVIALGGQTATAYVTRSGEHVVLGTHVNAAGVNESRSRLEAVANAPRDPQEWAALEDAAWISEGDADAERVVYVFTDPNCPYCNRFNAAARSVIEAGASAALRHILVGVIRPESARQSASILAADNPAERLRAYNAAFGGGNPPVIEGNPDTAPIEANNALMRELGIGGTPAIYYRDRADQIRRVSGLPEQSRIETILRGEPAE